jgi:hypothetical protein
MKGPGVCGGVGEEGVEPGATEESAGRVRTGDEDRLKGLSVSTAKATGGGVDGITPGDETGEGRKLLVDEFGVLSASKHVAECLAVGEGAETLKIRRTVVRLVVMMSAKAAGTQMETDTGADVIEGADTAEANMPLTGILKKDAVVHSCLEAEGGEAVSEVVDLGLPCGKAAAAFAVTTLPLDDVAGSKLSFEPDNIIPDVLG